VDAGFIGYVAVSDEEGDFADLCGELVGEGGREDFGAQKYE
jgi:hypothetical protein